MNRTEFIKELEYLLQDIPEADRADALAYYRDYLEDAGEDHEEDAIRELGSPERVAAIIRADLSGQMEEGGVFTDTGYQDERFRDPRYQVARRMDLPDVQESAGFGDSSADADSHAAGHGRAHTRADGRGTADSLPPRRTFARLLRVLILIALIFAAVPVLLGVGGSMSGIAAGIVCLFLAALVLVGLLTFTALLGAAAVLVLGFGMIVADFWSGVIWIGCGILLLGLGLLGVALSVVVYGKLIPWCIRTAVDAVSRVLHRGRRQSA